MVEASPAFPVERIGDVELRARVALGGVGPRPFVARGAELLAAEQLQPGLEARRVHLVDSRRDLRAGGHLLQRAGLRRIDPGDERPVDEGGEDAEALHQRRAHGF